MGLSLSKRLIDEMKAAGADRHTIAYHSANTEEDYEPILKDQQTPTHIIGYICERISLLSLKLLCINHTNISDKAILWLLQTTKDDMKKITLEIFKRKTLTHNFILEIKKKWGIAEDFKKITLVLLEEQADIPTETLDILFDVTPLTLTIKYYMDVIYAIIGHKNVSTSILKNLFLIEPEVFVDHILKSPAYTVELGLNIYEQTGNESLIPEIVKSVFLF